MGLKQLISEELQKHHQTRGMAVASGVTCQCGYWTGNEKGLRGGVDGLDHHRADVVIEVLKRVFQ